MENYLCGEIKMLTTDHSCPHDDKINRQLAPDRKMDEVYKHIFRMALSHYQGGILLFIYKQI